MSSKAADDKVAFELMLNQMSDSDSDSEGEQEGSKAAAHSMHHPPPKPFKPAPSFKSSSSSGGGRSSSGAGSSSSSSSGYKYGGGDSDYGGDADSLMEEEMTGTSRIKKKYSFASSDRGDDAFHASERKEAPEPRRSVVERILQESKLDTSRHRQRGGGEFFPAEGSGGFRHEEDNGAVISEIENFGSASAGPGFAEAGTAASRQCGKDEYSATRRWLTRPCTRGEAPLLCFVERERNMLSMQSVYRCYLEPSEEAGPRFLMAAKKKPGKQASYYLVSMEMNPDDRGSDALLGKLRANAVGSQYLLTDHGLKADKTAAPSSVRRELGLVRFQFDSGGPSSMGVWIPAVTPGGSTQNWQPLREADSMEASVDSKVLDRLTVLQSKHPKWDASHGGHVLNFQGRVTECSVKNFQLHTADPEQSEDINLQFGRVGKHKFVMDVKYPLSPLQAFAICVACVDGKIADRKGYEYIRKLTGL